MMMRKTLYLLILLPFLSFGQRGAGGNFNANGRFEQLGPQLPTPNTYRTAAGTPGKDYFQNTASYDIKVELNDAEQRIIGTEVITYTNQSPDDLKYLWLQLDQNLHNAQSTSNITKTGGIGERMTEGQLGNLPQLGEKSKKKEYGHNIKLVKDLKGANLPYTINGTMMRVDLPTPLKPGMSYSFRVDWDYNIFPYYGRSGYEYFPADDNYNYFIAHWFPRMCVYDDVNGWQHKQFLGQGEFTLPFGNYKVEITVPTDHVVAATGECQNYAKVLTKDQSARMTQAAKSTKPVIIVSQAEAEAKLKTKSTQKQTWVYTAQNVRDFAFASSRRFIWDAMQTDVYGNGKKIWSMSFYSKEGNPLWEQYSTRVVEHTLKVYGKYSIDYPYPVAISVHATAGGGMEYPMISFNGGRPEPDGTYSDRVKAGMIGVIIHEVGHNFFPMIINSDERQWSWMDEGLNSFVQYLAEQEWDRDFPSRRGEASKIVDYMRTDPTQQMPIMSSSDNIMQFGPNAYSKPATALNILRETIMGRELFDHAFKEYAKRWAFKHPQPADFFRTMEDASGVDLDWFWKGWFYGVEPVDQDLAEVEWYSLDTQNPEIAKAEARKQAEDRAKTISNMRNKTDIPKTVVEEDPTMKDFYNSYDPFAVTNAEKERYQKFLETLTPEEKQLMESGKNFYTLKLKNKGGLVMPVIIELQYEDGTSEVVRFPAEIWRLNDQQIAKTISTTKKVKKFVLDPYFETADIDTSNNAYPREPEQPTKFQLFKQRGFTPAPNPMQEAKKNQPAATQSSNGK